MGTTEPTYSPQPLPNTQPRSRNGLGVAALVIGVASLLAGLVGLIIAIVALAGGRNRGATNGGQAVAGLVCSILALIIGITLSVRVGTWAARNTDVFARFDKCVAQAANRTAVSVCIANFADDVRR